jgi:hypothetical protein
MTTNESGMSEGVPRVLNPHEYSEVILERDRQEAIAKAKRDEAALELDGQRWEQYKRKVRREEAEKAEQRQLEDEAIRAMTPAEYDSWKKRVPDPGLAPKLRTRYTIALQDIATEDAKARNRAREDREQELGLPKLQATHAARVQEFRDERIAAEAEADQAKQAAREREQEQLAELGPAPTLELLEVKA